MHKILTILMAMLLLTSCVKDKRDDTETPVGVGDKIPTLSVVTSDGTVVDNNSLRGKPSLICFFRTTCPDCQQEFPTLQRIYDDFKSVQVILISVGQENAPIAEYWSANNLTLPYSAQQDKTIAQTFGVSSIPQVYVCSADGVVRYLHGDSPIATYDQLSKELNELLND